VQLVPRTLLVPILLKRRVLTRQHSVRIELYVMSVRLDMIAVALVVLILPSVSSVNTGTPGSAETAQPTAIAPVHQETSTPALMDTITQLVARTRVACSVRRAATAPTVSRLPAPYLGSTHWRAGRHAKTVQLVLPALMLLSIPFRVRMEAPQPLAKHHAAQAVLVMKSAT
jgi:hypothetical protein